MEYSLVEYIKPNIIKQTNYINERKEVYIRDLPNRYKVIVENYHHIDPNVNFWDQKVIIVYEIIDLYTPPKQICEIGRNYPSFTAVYVRQNNYDYLITSGDYQSITIINLTKKEIKEYTDTNRRKKGWGFCPIWFNADEDYLCIEGCVWGGDMERMHCYNINFENPIEAFNNAEWSDDENNFYEDIDEEECY